MKERDGGCGCKKSKRVGPMPKFGGKKQRRTRDRGRDGTEGHKSKIPC